jgi:general stress protein 26
MVAVDESQRCDIEANPRISVLVVDPDDTSRFIEVRGEAELVADVDRCAIHARRITLDAIHS